MAAGRTAIPTGKRRPPNNNNAVHGDFCAGREGEHTEVSDGLWRPGKLRAFVCSTEPKKQSLRIGLTVTIFSRFLKIYKSNPHLTGTATHFMRIPRASS